MPNTTPCKIIPARSNNVPDNAYVLIRYSTNRGNIAIPTLAAVQDIMVTVVRLSVNTTKGALSEGVKRKLAPRLDTTPKVPYIQYTFGTKAVDINPMAIIKEPFITLILNP